MKRPCTRSTPQHFNPRSPDGERPLRRPVCRIHAKFQSTLPGWGVTAPCRATVPAPSNFNPRSPDGERQGDMRLYTCRVYISIHAPRMGSDTVHATPTHGTTDFNPRSPDGERHLRVLRVFHPCHFNPRSPDGERLGSAHVSIFPQIFQSTLPGWGATGRSQSAMSLIQISIHAPRIGSDKFDCVVASGPAWISIHAPRMGSDRPSCEKRPLYEISIHAPRMGSDRRFRPFAPRNRYFNPRSPDGERPLRIILRICALLFQSTLPGWGATASKKSCSEQGANFNPRSPDGERLYYTYVDKWFHVFQSTLPGWGATTDSMMGSPLLKDFNPRSPDGERRVPLTYASCICQFQSTLPGWGATPGAEHAKCGRRISIHAPRMGSDKSTSAAL